MVFSVLSSENYLAIGRVVVRVVVRVAVKVVVRIVRVDVRVRQPRTRTITLRIAH